MIFYDLEGHPSFHEKFESLENQQSFIVLIGFEFKQNRYLKEYKFLIKKSLCFSEQ